MDGACAGRNKLDTSQQEITRERQGMTFQLIYNLFLYCRTHELSIVHPYPGAILEEESPLSLAVHDYDAVQVSHLRRMKTPLWLNLSR
jgi:hypothetical protein